VAYFQSEENRAELQRLFDLGVAPVWEESVKADGKFAGKNVVLTGTLERYKRGEAQKLIEAEGGVCQSSVTAKTDLVIAGESAGSKLDKARKAGVKIIDEAEFLRILEEE
jgi:DNA ligase (NAD+)